MPEENADPAAPASKRKPLIRTILAVLALCAVVVGIQKWMFSRNHETTDDAQVAADVVIISPLVQGTVAEVLVKDNQLVKKGDPILKLESSKLQAAVDQAKASLNAALADAKAAGASVELADQTTRANEGTAQAVVQESSAAINAAQRGADATQAAVAGAEANARSATAALNSARIDEKVAEDNARKAADAVEAAKADLATAQATITQAQANLGSAKAASELAAKTLARTEALCKEGAVSQAELDVARDAATRAAESVKAAEGALAVANAQAKQRQALLNAARVQQDQAARAISQARERVTIAQESGKAAQASLKSIAAQASASAAGVTSAMARQETSRKQAAATAAQRLSLDKSKADQQQALARVEQARAALRTAKIDLDHATLYAPCDGRISKRTVDVGSFVQVGTATMFLVPESAAYVIANFKETQVNRMHEGDPVDIDVDGMPGQHFHGHLDSLSPATGATFALLPPDNSTGNFVKVVQRVPVKIALDEGAAKTNLKVGYSVLVTVQTR